MIMYRGFRATYLGLRRWKVTSPTGLMFDIMAPNISSLMERIERWRHLYEGNRT